MPGHPTQKCVRRGKRSIEERPRRWKKRGKLLGGSGELTSFPQSQDDESRLLFDDADGTHYGSFGEPAMNDQDDAQESQREFEALQSVVARTSE